MAKGISKITVFLLVSLLIVILLVAGIMSLDLDKIPFLGDFIAKIMG